MQPADGSLDLPSSVVPAHPPAVIRRRLHAVGAVRTEESESGSGQFASQRVAVVCLIRNDRDAMGQFDVFRDRVEGRSDQVRFRNIGRRRRGPDRDAVGVGDDFDLAPLPDLGFPDLEAPFWAGTKVASANSSSVSSTPAAASSSKTAAQISAHKPAPVQSLCRRQQVGPEGNSDGRSRQRTPLRRTYTIPARHARSSWRGRPPLGLAAAGGKRGSTRAHKRSSKAASAATDGMTTSVSGHNSTMPVFIRQPEF